MTDAQKEVSATDQALLALLDTAKQGKDFVLEQAPDVIQQLIVYNTIRECVWLVSGLAISTFGGWLLRYGRKMDKEDPYGNDVEIAMYMISGVAATLLGVLMTFNNLLDLSKILFAPKVWLIEYAARLVL